MKEAQGVMRNQKIRAGLEEHSEEPQISRKVQFMEETEVVN